MAPHRLAWLFDKQYLGSFSSDDCEDNFRKELYRRLTAKPFKIPPELSNEKSRKLTEAEREKAFAKELAERNRQARESLKAICTDDELAPLGDNLLFETFRAVAWSRPKFFHSSDELAKLLDGKLERDVSVYIGEQRRYPNNWIDHRTFPKVWEVKATATTK